MAELAVKTVRRRSSQFSSPSSVDSASLQGKTLVITGGSGWLGSRIAKLAYDHWEDLKEIRLFSLDPPAPNVVSDITGFNTCTTKPKVSFHPGNILDEESLSTAFAKADVVIHCAAAVENGSFVLRRQMKRVNIDGTQRVVQACLDCGVRALVYTGSLAQVMTESSKLPVHYDETYQLPAKAKLLFPPYGGSKDKAENLVLLADGQEGRKGIKLRTCSLRCPVMYGEGDRSVLLTLRAAQHCYGYHVPLGFLRDNGTTMQSLYVGNAAWAHVLAAKKLLNGIQDAAAEDSGLVLEPDVDVGGKFYYIGDYSPICSMLHFQAQFLRPLGYRVFPFGIPLFFLKIFVLFLEILLFSLALVGIDVCCPLNRNSLRYLQFSHSFSWEKARKELNYTPLYSHKTSLAQSMEFYRKALR